VTDYAKADRWGRPIIPHPETGVEQSWTRVTTVAKTLDDMNGLLNWTGTMVAGGAVLRPDIAGKVAARWPLNDDNRAEMYALAEELKEAGGASVGRNLGDTLHEMVKRRNKGEDFRPMAPWDADLAAYESLMAKYGLVVNPGLVERTVILPEIGVAGSFDLLAGVVKANDELHVTDLKTGKVGRWSWGAFCVQLALYSRASWLYDWDTGKFSEMPPVNQKRGLIIHLPAGAAKATLHVVDLEAGWKAAQLALAVRQWRARTDLARPAKVKGT
jgi:hypothetical protein